MILPPGPGYSESFLRQMFQPKVLSPNQLNILTAIEFPPNLEIYLAGGTGLALQIGHRTSVDFDFYGKRHFDANEVSKKLVSIFPSFDIEFVAKDTLRGKVRETEVSLFYYDYPLIFPLRNFRGIKIASVQDIAAMKLAAIIQRGTKRDFIDIFYLLKTYTLKRLIGFALKKYKGYQEMLILRALIYFEDADKEKYPRAIKIIDPGFSWEKAKEKILDEVKKYQFLMIKGS